MPSASMLPGDHIDQIMAVMQAAFDPAFGEAWNRRQVEDAMILGHCHYRLIGADGVFDGISGDAAGFTLSRLGFDEEELLLFAVMPEFRGTGLGGRLLAELKLAAAGRGAERLLLEMRDGNPAESLYRSHGFKPVGRRRSYYRSPQGIMIDAVTFACPLS